MIPTVWLLGALPRAPGLTEALDAIGVQVRSADGLGTALLAETYDARGLVLVDAFTPEGRDVLSARGAAALPVLAIAEADEPLPPGVLRLRAHRHPDDQLRDVLDVLNEPRNLRRHPRVAVRLPVDLAGQPGVARDLSLYGIRVSPAPLLAPGVSVELTVALAGGAVVRLIAELLEPRGDEGSALRCRPRTDEDLLLWLNLILAGLDDSPLHADSDPFEMLRQSD